MGAPSQSFMPVVTSSGTLEEAFPDVDPNFEPFGSLVLLQVRVAKRTISKDSKIELPDEVRATIQANTQVAKVIAHGPLAFCNRNTGEKWPEGAWARPGEYIRIPKYAGDRWEVKHEDGVVTFVLLRDLELSGRVPRPLDVVAYV
jgi:hypothetical protein